MKGFPFVKLPIGKVPYHFPSIFLPTAIQRAPLAVLWALARLEIRRPDVTKAVTTRMTEALPSSTAGGQALSLAAWALARLNAPDKALLAALAERMVRPGGLQDFSDQSLVNTA
jgi:hypothetical protein